MVRKIIACFVALFFGLGVGVFSAAEGNPETWYADWGYIAYGTGSRGRITSDTPFLRWGMGTTYYGHLLGDSRDDDRATPWGIYIDMSAAQAGYIYYVDLDLNVSAVSDTYSGAYNPMYQDYDYRVTSVPPSEGDTYGQYLSSDSYLGNAISTSCSVGSDNRCSISIIISTAYAPELVGTIVLITGKWVWGSVGNIDRYYNDGITMKANNAGLSMQADRDGSYYQQALIDQIAVGNAAASQYYSDSLAKLDSIKGDIAALPDAIGDILDQQAQSEKQEASTDGDAHIGQATSALSDMLPIASLKDAFVPLVSACGYTGTTSVWTLPAITIPAIGNIVPAMELSSAQSIDIGAYVLDLIPSSVLQVCQYVGTIALILFCVRELMGFFRGGRDGG